VSQDITTVFDASALQTNPAALTFITQPAISLGSSWSIGRGTYSAEPLQVLRDTTVVREWLVQYLSGVVPIPVYRGAWVVGASLQPDLSFLAGGHYRLTGESIIEVDQSEQGGIARFSIGTAVLFRRHLSLGGALTYRFGKDRYSDRWRQKDSQSEGWAVFDSIYIEPSYHGIETTWGIVGEIPPYLFLGLTITPPSWIKVKEYSTHFYWSGSGGSSNDQFTLYYRLRGPWRVAWGGTLAAKPLFFSWSYRWVDYQHLGFSSNILDVDSVSIDDQVSGDIKMNLRTVGGWGFALTITGQRFTLQLGTNRNPLPISHYSGDNERWEGVVRWEILPTLNLSLFMSYDKRPHRLFLDEVYNAQSDLVALYAQGEQSYREIVVTVQYLL